MGISVLVNFAKAITDMLTPSDPAKLSDAQLLRATRRARFAKKVSEAVDKTLGAEIRGRLAVRPVEDATGDAKLVKVPYRTYNVDAAVQVLSQHNIALASVLSVTNKAVEALPAHILAQISYVEEPGTRLMVTGKGMDERE
jgi:hypothetical protein